MQSLVLKELWRNVKWQKGLKNVWIYFDVFFFLKENFLRGTEFEQAAKWGTVHVREQWPPKFWGLSMLTSCHTKLSWTSNGEARKKMPSEVSQPCIYWKAIFLTIALQGLPYHLSSVRKHHRSLCSAEFVHHHVLCKYCLVTPDRVRRQIPQQ